MALLIAALVALGAAIGNASVAAQGNPEAARITNPVAATPESIAKGKQL
jgi:hypothetical protein